MRPTDTAAADAVAPVDTMPLDPSKYILPPAIGESNELYEAYPQAADTVFSKSVTTTSIRADNSDLISGIMGDVNSPIPKVTGTTQPSPLNPSSWKFPSLSDVFTGMGNGPGGATDAMKQNPIASAIGLPTQDTIAKYVVRGIVAILGFIFVAVGLTMMGAKSRIGSEIIREVRKVV